MRSFVKDLMANSIREDVGVIINKVPSYEDWTRFEKEVLNYDYAEHCTDETNEAWFEENIREGNVIHFSFEVMNGKIITTVKDTYEDGDDFLENISPEGWIYNYSMLEEEYLKKPEPSPQESVSKDNFEDFSKKIEKIVELAVASVDSELDIYVEELEEMVDAQEETIKELELELEKTKGLVSFLYAMLRAEVKGQINTH